ncbi:MAG: hypothetical protein R3C03_18745 [Pirellulaceae bacterium]
MTTVESAQKAFETIQHRLDQLRSQLRRWIVVRGLGKWLFAALAILILDMLVDRVFKMDGAQRLIVLMIMLGTMGYVLYRFLLKPLGKSISNSRLLRQIEDRNRDLHENLIASYELSEQRNWSERGISEALASQTIATGLERSQQLDFTRVLDFEAHRKHQMLLAGGGLAVLLLAIGIASSSFLNTWFRRNLLLSSDQWPRATNLQFVGAVDGTIVVPRGADHRQLVLVTEDSRVSDVEVTLETENANGKSFQKMKPTGREGGREHAFVFHSIASEYRMRASGGDGQTEWTQIKLVEPPAVLDLKLSASLPEYTKQDKLELSGSGPFRLLNGSQLNVSITSNKPLTECKLLNGEMEWALAAANEQRDQFQVDLGADGQGVIGGKYVFVLNDESGLANIREFSFELRMGDDKAPIVRAQMLGISGLVVPNATIPLSFTAEDDFGISALNFETSWTDENSDGSNELTFPAAAVDAATNPKELSDVAVMELEQLKLQAGTSLRFDLAANDNQQPTAATGRSREFLVRVVTEDELRADLLRREIEQRKSFQQAYDSQMQLISELREVVAAPAANLPPEDVINQRQDRLVSLYRSQRGIGTSVDLIAKRFEEFLVEVFNNHLDDELKELDPEQTLTRRFNDRIINPIRRMDAELITAAANQIDASRRNVENIDTLNQEVQATTQIQEQILEQMRVIMASMESSESFQEAVNQALEIKRFEENLRKQIESQGDLKGIFDDD